MTNGSEGNLQDLSMLELFLTEVEIHTAILSDGLLALETAPQALDKIESLMRAAHSIKGGARIVNLEAVVNIAHAMEDCFVAVQNGKGTLGSGQIDILLDGVDMIRAIAETAGAGKPDWERDRQEDVKTLVMALTHLLETSAPREQLQKQEAIAADTSSPIDETPIVERVREDEARKTPEAFSDVDSSMLGLFRSEVTTHTSSLTNGLLAVQHEPEANDGLETLLKAAHALKGGAQLVDLKNAILLAHEIERYVVALQKGSLTVEEEHIHTLQKGFDLLRAMAQASLREEPGWMLEHQAEIDEMVAVLAALSPNQPGTPSSASVAHVSQGAAASATEDVSSDSHVPERQNIFEQPPDQEGGKRFALSEHREETARKTIERDRTIRVTAAKIERLMALAGEVVVNSRWLPTFSELLFAQKKQQRALLGILENLRETLRREAGNAHLRERVSEAREQAKQMDAFLAERLTQLERFTGASATLSERLYHEVIGIRMRPFADGIRGFPRMVRDLSKALGKKVQFEIVGKSTEVDRDILEKLDAPLTHLLRNAIDHGIESPQERLAAGKPEFGILRLEAVHRSGMLSIIVSDDGRGIEPDALRQRILKKGLADGEIVNRLTEAELLRFLFLPGFSTSDHVTEISGRGVGLDVVDNMVHEVGGVVRAASNAGAGANFYLELPLTLSVIRTFLVEIDGEPYAFPLARIDRCLLLSGSELDIVEDRQYFQFDHKNIALFDIHDVLDREKSPRLNDELPVVVMSNRANSYGVVVDKFIGESDLVVRPLDERLGKVPDISATAVMLDGSPILIFDVEDLVGSIDKILSSTRLQKVKMTGETPKATALKRILVVDDSITVREMERKLLENKGYQVEVAVDGVAGWNAVRTESFDLVISDIDMPRMNGIEFISQMKQNEQLRTLPVVIVSYKDTEEHRIQGLQAGADYYLTKSSFQDDSFIHAVVDLIGEA